MGNAYLRRGPPSRSQAPSRAVDQEQQHHGNRSAGSLATAGCASGRPGVPTWPATTATTRWARPARLHPRAAAAAGPRVAAAVHRRCVAELGCGPEEVRPPSTTHGEEEGLPSHARDEKSARRTAGGSYERHQASCVCGLWSCISRAAGWRRYCVERRLWAPRICIWACLGHIGASQRSQLTRRWACGLHWRGLGARGAPPLRAPRSIPVPTEERAQTSASGDALRVR